VGVAKAGQYLEVFKSLVMVGQANLCGPREFFSEVKNGTQPAKKPAQIFIKFWCKVKMSLIICGLIQELLCFSVPPKFDDLGKEARDVFGKEFGYGFFKLDAKTLSKKGVVSN
jgi:hypothetical protein